MSGTTVNSGPIVPERTSSATDFSNSSVAQRKVERMHSKTRREHAHHHSHSSKHHRDEQKTVGEYALHVLFTSVSCENHFHSRAANVGKHRLLIITCFLVYCAS